MKKPPIKQNNLTTISPLVIKSILLFASLFIGGFVFLWIFSYKEVYTHFPKLLAVASSAPGLAILSEFWKSKEKNEAFVKDRKAEVDAQINALREEFKRELATKDEELKRKIATMREDFQREINERDLENARLKGEMKSATRFWQVSDNVSAVKNGQEELQSRLKRLEERIGNGENPCD